MCRVTLGVNAVRTCRPSVLSVTTALSSSLRRVLCLVKRRSFEPATAGRSCTSLCVCVFGVDGMLWFETLLLTTVMCVDLAGASSSSVIWYWWSSVIGRERKHSGVVFRVVCKINGKSHFRVLFFLVLD